MDLRYLRMLKVDIDPGQELLSLEHLAKLLRRSGKRILWMRQERSGSGKGWHLTIRVSPPCSSAMEVVALQAVLGSDRYREACNVLRVRNLGRVSRYWRERWNVFYDGGW